MNDHIEDVTRRFADAGYHAIAPALFHRAGGGTAPYDDFEKVLPLFEGLTDPGIVMDVDAAVGAPQRGRFRRPRHRDRRVLHGRSRDLPGLPRAAPSVPRPASTAGASSPPGSPSSRPCIDRVGSLQTPWLGLFGDEDSSIPVEDVERLRAELDGADVPADGRALRRCRARVPLRPAAELPRRGRPRRVGPHPRVVRGAPGTRGVDPGAPLADSTHGRRPRGPRREADRVDR